jgi:hypothetical protein
MVNLAKLVEAGDAERAHALWEQAAAAGQTEAQERLT